jgi:hypothetical protein
MSRNHQENIDFQKKDAFCVALLKNSPHPTFISTLNGMNCSVEQFIPNVLF